MKILILILLSLTLLGCGATQQERELGYTTHIDPYKNYQKYTALNAGYLDGQSLLSLQFLWLDIFVDVLDGEHSLWVAATLEGDHWQFINPGESLVLMLDGKPLTLFSGTGSTLNRQVLSSRTIREKALYKISPEILEKIALASNVSLRLYGHQGYIERSLSANHLINYRAFYERFVMPRKDKFVNSTVVRTAQ